MLTVKELKDMLSKYPEDMRITNEQSEDFIHIGNTTDTLIISVKNPIGTCNRTGGNVFPSLVVGYEGYCPELDEDLCRWEFKQLDDYIPDELQEAMDKVTIEMLNDLTYSEEQPLNEKYCLYHYSEDDLVVLNHKEDWEELYTVQWNTEKEEIIFEKC
jgi:hypothetical protein